MGKKQQQNTAEHSYKHVPIHCMHSSSLTFRENIKSHLPTACSTGHTEPTALSTLPRHQLIRVSADTKQSRHGEGGPRIPLTKRKRSFFRPIFQTAAGPPLKPSTTRGHQSYQANTHIFGNKLSHANTCPRASCRSAATGNHDRRPRTTFMNLRASSFTNSVRPSRLLRAALIWASSSAGWEESTATTREAPPAAALRAKPPL